MGHYASEMSYHTRTPPTTEELQEERDARKAHLQHVWNLWNQYRAQGDSPGRYNDKTPCPECRSPICFEDMPDHEEWHQQLRSINLLGPGLF